MEDIRELAWKGNLIALRHLVEYMGVDVNEKHAMNGTTRTKCPVSLFFVFISLKRS
jgi:hypothetical protein